MGLRVLSGLEELAGHYDAAILDSWGVLHNGVEPYPGVLECLVQLRIAGWSTIVLSNAPRDGDSVIEQVSGFGIPADAYGGIVTSGDLTRTALSERSDPFHGSLGRRFFHLGPERDYGLLDGLSYSLAEDLDEADFVLNTGLYDDTVETASDYAGFLTDAFVRNLPMICANPDIEVVRGGHKIACAGAVARAYEELGGVVVYHGKPDPTAFAVCAEKLSDVESCRILVVGDSLATDIAGAAAAGFDALFVTGGIHSAELGQATGRSSDARTLMAGLVARGAAPTAAISSLVWSAQ